MPAADHSCVRSGSNDKNEYRPRNPEDSLLYRTIAAHLETFLARQQERGREVPQFIEREMRAYLSCGVLACGFLRLKCESCGKERLLPLSCKGRSVCPSCCGRRMADTAAHLVDRVFPHVPARQWVLSLPFALRYRLAYDAEMVTAVLGVFIRALFGLYRRMARDYGIDQSQCGAVTFAQRFGSAANLHLHFHVIAMDGVYAPGLDGKPEFFALRPPENGEVRELAQLLAKRIPALLTRRGAGTLPPDEGESDRLARDQPWLSEVYAASVSGRIATGPEAGRRVAVGRDRVDPESIDSSASPRCAAVAGFSLHGNVAIHAEDRSRLERLFRYAARPPLSMDRSTSQRTASRAGEMSGPVRITHPFHPLFGREIDFVNRIQRWGEDWVVYRDPDEYLLWLPARWTSVEAEDPFIIVSAGRSHFRAADLIDLAALIAAFRRGEAADGV